MNGVFFQTNGTQCRRNLAGSALHDHQKPGDHRQPGHHQITVFEPDVQQVDQSRRQQPHTRKRQSKLFQHSGSLKWLCS